MAGTIAIELIYTLITTDYDIVSNLETTKAHMKPEILGLANSNYRQKHRRILQPWCNSSQRQNCVLHTFLMQVHDHWFHGETTTFKNESNQKSETP